MLAVSQGGWVAILATTMTDRIRFVATISSPVVTPYEADTVALANAMRRVGLDDRSVGEVLELWTAEARLIRDLKSQTLWTAYEERVERARSRPWWVKSEYEPLTQTAWFGSWYAQVLDFDPMPILEQSTVPSLWLYGAADPQSDTAKSAALLSGLARRGRPVTVRVFDRGDHGIMVGETGSGDFPAAADGFLDALHRWLDAQR